MTLGFPSVTSTVERCDRTSLGTAHQRHPTPMLLLLTPVQRICRGHQDSNYGVLPPVLPSFEQLDRLSYYPQLM